MTVYFLVCFFQILFNIFKTMEIKYTYEQKLKALLFNSVWINLVSLAGTYFSIQRLLAGDWLVILSYVVGSILGKWIAMTQFENAKEAFYKFFKIKYRQI